MSTAAIIDANVNRFKEGARVLEDIARFVLKDKALFDNVKNLKHLLKVKPIDRSKLVDLGGADYMENQHRHSLIDLVNANALRMQEAARVLEEIDNRMLFKKVRFAAYDIHSQILVKLQLFLKMDKLQGIYAICDPRHQSFDDITRKVRDLNISVCQIRMKASPKRAVLGSTVALKAKLGTNTLLIVNDHLDIALYHADGVHLGQADLPIHVARKLSPADFIIGATCHTVAQAQQACREGANYIAVGCLYPTSTKKNTTQVSLRTLKAIVDSVKIPVCGIGGLNKHNQAQVLQRGGRMIAMYSALWGGN